MDNRRWRMLFSFIFIYIGDIEMMYKVKEQWYTGKYSVLFINFPPYDFKYVKIDGRTFKAEVVYDMDGCIDIESDTDFIGKEIVFVR